MASSDGESVKILGYKWMTEADLLSPGLGELNLNKKIRCMKKKKIKSSSFQGKHREITQFNHANKKNNFEKVAEFYDPCGFWEPIKLQMKLAMLPLNGLEWDKKIPELEQILSLLLL